VPIYEYRCDACGALYEVFQKMSDDPLETCEKCGARVRKVLHPVAVHFKGSGFYTTDYGKGTSRRSGAAEQGAGDGASADKTTGDAAGKSPAGGAKGADGGSSGSAAESGGKPKEKQTAT
jgi:putative FmdB family regulatory protein